MYICEFSVDFVGMVCDLSWRNKI